MTPELIRDALGWCTLINFGILVLWGLLFMGGGGWMKGLHGRWFKLADGEFDRIHYAVLAYYKVGLILFNLVPYLALRIVI